MSRPNEPVILKAFGGLLKSEPKVYPVDHYIGSHIRIPHTEPFKGPFREEDFSKPVACKIALFEFSGKYEYPFGMNGPRIAVYELVDD